jgi:glycosyltransferase involved in cell wall biosynthesis
MRIAFLTPRYSEQATIGGAETLIKQLALRAVASGHDVSLLTTCAANHFTWANELPAGTSASAGMTVHRFVVDTDRDLEAFIRAQNRISAGGPVGEEDERDWMSNNVNSADLIDYLRREGDHYDALVMGPYLFSLIFNAALVHPHKTLLVPCLHDEPFARLKRMQQLFGAVAGFLFNTEPEMGLARRLFDVPAAKSALVGMGLADFDVDATAFARRHGLAVPYIMYAGRREPLKGTPLLLDYLYAFRQRTGRDVRLVLTGSGPIDPPDELWPFITDLGFVSEQEKQEAMAGALAFVHPSLNESLGIVLLEAWLAGTPGLVHAGSEVLRWQCHRSGGGLWFRHYPDFEEMLKRLLDTPDLRRRLGAAGRAYVLQTYDQAMVDARLFSALEKVAALTGNSGR